MEHAGGRRVAIVAGGTYGLGQATTIRLARDGYHVVAFGLNARQVGSTAENTIDGTLVALKEEGLTADVLEADVSKAPEVANVAQFALRTYGRVDALVNDVAIRAHCSFLETDEETFNKHLSVNLTGMFLMSKAVVPHMIEAGGGAIVNVSSGSGWGWPGMLAYATSKGGVFGLSSSMAYDLKAHHVRVNVVVPALTLTGMTEGNPDVMRRVNTDITVANRPMSPSDTANAIAFLLSDDAAQITGAVLNVGGFYNQGAGDLRIGRQS